MSLIGILTLRLGPSIAKSILRLWIRDPDWRESTTSGLVDIISWKTDDIVAKQRGKRQFEDIGEKIALQLKIIFDTEGKDIDEGSQEAIAIEVSETLNDTRIGVDLLLDQRLEPSKLARFFIEASLERTLLFSEAEKILYRRLIEETSQYVVDIASRLPGFTERSFGEILKQGDEIGGKIDDILEEIRLIRVSAINSNPSSAFWARFETEYRLAVVRKFDLVELFGADVASSSQRYPLSVAYINLSIRKAGSYDDFDDDELEDEDWVSQNARNDEENEWVTMPVDKALSQSTRVLIKGLAGSGKTTLLQWLAVRSASQTFSSILSEWNDTIPFLIRLRHYAQDVLPLPEQFAKITAPAIAGTMPEHWVHARLHSGRALVLIDGVDEVPNALRRPVRDWINDLVSTYPKSKFIITSRPHAVSENWLLDRNFVEADLQPLDLPDVMAFVEHWHKAVYQETRNEEERSKLQQLCENLKQYLSNIRSVRNLATNPLLCALICALHRSRRGELPMDRIELYGASCEMLMERRDKESLVPLSDYPFLTYRQKLLLVQDLAYWFLTNGWTVVPEVDVISRLDRKLKNMQGIDIQITGDKILQYFSERSGIVRKPTADKVDFVHKTFQEYLAAQQSLAEGDIGVLVKNAHDDQWHEVVIIAAGLASTKLRDHLLGELLKRGEKEQKRRHQLHVLAVACLETAIEISPQVKREVERRLDKLIPPKNMTEAKSLSAAGELVVPYLTYNSANSAMVTAASARTLILVSGYSALHLLEGYAIDPRQSVRDELIDGWSSFDRREYAKRILSKLFSLRNAMDFTGLPNLEGFEYFTWLSSLDLSGCPAIEDISPLSNLKSLKRLNLAGCINILDFSPLSVLTTLTDLDVGFCKAITTLEPLRNMRDLLVLDLSNCKNLDDIDGLIDLSNIISLSLSHCRGIGDFNPLSRLITLENLDLSHCLLENLGPLSSLKNLKEISLYNCSEVRDIHPLSLLENLEVLNLGYCESVVNLTPLRDLPRLREVIIPGLVNNMIVPEKIIPYIRYSYP